MEATANDNLKRKASEETSEPKNISYEPKEISDHIQYWKQYDSALTEKSNEQVIQLIEDQLLPYILDSPKGKEIVAEKEKLVAMMLSSSSGVVPREGNSLQEDVPGDLSLSLIGADDDATFIKALQSASATEVAAALKRP